MNKTLSQNRMPIKTKLSIGDLPGELIRNGDVESELYKPSLTTEHKENE